MFHFIVVCSILCPVWSLPSSGPKFTHLFGVEKTSKPLTISRKRANDLPQQNFLYLRNILSSTGGETTWLVKFLALNLDTFWRHPFPEMRWTKIRLSRLYGSRNSVWTREREREKRRENRPCSPSKPESKTQNTVAFFSSPSRYQNVHLHMYYTCICIRMRACVKAFWLKFFLNSITICERT